MGEVDSRAQIWKEGADLEEVDPDEATHSWVTSVCRSREQLEEPERQSRLQGSWLGLRDPGGSVQLGAPESPSGRSIRSVVLPDEG